MPEPNEGLDLPPLDGGSDEPAIEAEDDVAIRDEENPYDDETGDDADFTEGLLADDETGDDADFTEGLLADDETSALGDDAAGVGETDDDVPAELQSESMLGEE